VSLRTEAALSRTSTPRGQRTLFVSLACLVVPAVIVLSFLPSNDKHLLHTRGHFHSWGHFAVFCVVSFVVARAARSLQSRVLLFLGSLIFGYGIELAEHLTFHAPLEWKDVLVDAAGVIAGTLFAIASVGFDDE
jgi:hypothetical protein